MPDVGAVHRHWSIPSRIDRLAELRSNASQLALEHGFSAEAAEEFALCLHEAVSNAIEHGHGTNPELPVAIEIETLPDGLRVTVSNQGPPFDVEAMLRRQAGDGEWGRGLQIITSLTDQADWTDGGRRLCFVKRR